MVDLSIVMLVYQGVYTFLSTFLSFLGGRKKNSRSTGPPINQNLVGRCVA
jgi:hypothetical protein